MSNSFLVRFALDTFCACNHSDLRVSSVTGVFGTQVKPGDRVFVAGAIDDDVYLVGALRVTDIQSGEAVLKMQDRVQPGAITLVAADDASKMSLTRELPAILAGLLRPLIHGPVPIHKLDHGIAERLAASIERSSETLAA